MDAETYARLGAVCGMVGYYKEAAAVYERAVEMGYRTPEAYNNMGVSYLPRRIMHVRCGRLNRR